MWENSSRCFSHLPPPTSNASRPLLVLQKMRTTVSCRLLFLHNSADLQYVAPQLFSLEDVSVCSVGLMWKFLCNSDYPCHFSPNLLQSFFLRWKFQELSGFSRWIHHGFTQSNNHVMCHSCNYHTCFVMCHRAVSWWFCGSLSSEVLIRLEATVVCMNLISFLACQNFTGNKLRYFSIWALNPVSSSGVCKQLFCFISLRHCVIPCTPFAGHL